ncbi:hypothetical protein NKW44_10405 [Acetobacter lovaniensis]|jgi:hypothetical protein|uniref:hypothetical protein n=1 Tax=Acetobacter lovaniensis TaxID=104100 RepID=UPI0020A07F90|nr:hypothetical protein [Acetobacter lovaniensis]MCI1698323.1 hypothetical protein [Acetobacter lovaniensis]MCP1240099.1 hypothetical protein [Acetobacter lovaniensis]
MKLDIIQIDGFDTPYYPIESNEMVQFSIPDQFWVIDISVSPSFKLVGPFYSLQEAKKCLARIEAEYQRLLEEEKFDHSAFKAFIEQENVDREEKIRQTRKYELENYTHRLKAAGMDDQFNM